MLAAYGLPASRAPLAQEQQQRRGGLPARSQDTASMAAVLLPMMVMTASTTEATQPINLRPPIDHSHLQQHPASRLDLGAQRLIGVARWPDPAFNQEASAAQQQYGQRFSDASVKLGGDIAKGQIGSMQNLWKACKEWRVEVAQSQDDKHASNFGADRRNEAFEGVLLRTKMHPPYNYIRARTIESTQVHKHHANVDAEAFIAQDGLRLSLWMTIELEGKKVRLTEMKVTDNAKDNIFGGANGVMVHTNAKLITPLLKLADDVFRNTLQPEAGREQRMQGLAEIHWLLTQACPDGRGSAAKAELAVRAMAHAMDMELPPMRRGIQADLEAFVTPKDVFIAKYADFFEA